MQRSMLNSSCLRASRLLVNNSSKRAFSTSSKASQRTLSRWMLPSSIISIGLASYYLSQPLFLDTDKSKTKKAEKPSTEIPTEEETAKPASEDSEDGEAKQQSAYNPDTGEINWDCPCLGGMAHGPCGEEFKEAFSCFVFSEAEPKGFDCIEKFKNMQNCFRRYPEVYSEEIRDDEGPVDTLEAEPESELAPAPAPAPASETPSSAADEVTFVEEVEVVEIPAAEKIEEAPVVEEVTN